MTSGTAYGRIDLNPRALATWLWAGALLAVGILVYLILDKPAFYSVLPASVPLVVYVVTHPRVALVQFIFAIFVAYAIEPTIPLFLADVSTCLLIAAAVVDVLVSGRLPERIPRLTWNLVYFIAALAVCGFLGHWPELLIRRIPSICLLLAVLWSVYRLCDHMTIRRLIDWFLAVAVLNSAYVLSVFVASGGAERSFGVSSVIFDDYVMVAMPMALAMYLWAEGRKSILYMGATFICLGGLIATQSRLSILFGLAAAGFVLLAAYSRARRTACATADCRVVKRRIRLLLAAAGGLVVLVVVANQDIFSAVVGRFEQLIGGDPFRDVGSVRFRAALWKRAFVTWMDHPFFGVGPGGFERLNELYSAMHIGPDYRYIKGLGTHNMLLEYLATTGIVGGAGLLALAANKFRLARRAWRRQSTDSPGPSLALYAWAALFIITTLIEAGWTWRPPSLLMAFLAALVARQYSDAFDNPPPPVSS